MSVIDTVIDSKKLEELVDVAKPGSAPAPELTAEKVATILAQVREVEKNNGYLAIAMKNKVSPEVVKEIDRKRREKIASLQVEPVPKEK